jgi:hypothetical protein
MASSVARADLIPERRLVDCLFVVFFATSNHPRSIRSMGLCARHELAIVARWRRKRPTVAEGIKKSEFTVLCEENPVNSRKVQHPKKEQHLFNTLAQTHLKSSGDRARRRGHVPPMGASSPIMRTISYQHVASGLALFNVGVLTSSLAPSCLTYQSSAFRGRMYRR